MRIVALALLIATAWICPTAEATVVSWWRFEDGEDDDPSANGLENPNEVSGEPAMISDNATIGNNIPDLFDTSVPGANVPNTGSVRSYVNGGSDDGIFGTAAYSSTLDVNSITVEFWMRTTENDAGFVARLVNVNQAGETGSLSNGFRIVDPNNVRVEYWVSENNGNNPVKRTLTSNVSVNNGNWHYIAFTYDAATGVGKLYIDDAFNPAATRNDNDNRRLWWGSGSPQPQVVIGYRMDGNPNNNTGTLDEIRFTDFALPPDDLLVVPEASQWAAVGTMVIVVTAVTLYRRRRIDRSPR